MSFAKPPASNSLLLRIYSLANATNHEASTVAPAGTWRFNLGGFIKVPSSAKLSLLLIPVIVGQGPVVSGQPDDAQEHVGRSWVIR